MRDPRTTGQVAASAVIGGAAAVRVQGLADVQFTRAAVEVPVIGLWKDGHDGVFITPTLRHALAVANAGAHVVAIDGTRRERPDGLTLAQTIAGLHAESHALVMADCGSLEDAAAAVDAGRRPDRHHPGRLHRRAPQDPGPRPGAAGADRLR